MSSVVVTTDEDSSDTEFSTTLSDTELDSDFMSSLRPEGVTLDDVRATYRGLGVHKWKECIDVGHARHGKMVYDECLHGKNGGQKEPGYLSSMLKAFDYIESQLGVETTVDMWLEAHRCAFSHHDGSVSGIGELRPKQRGNYLNVPQAWPGHPRGMHPEALHELAEMGEKLVKLGPTQPGEPLYRGAAAREIRLRFQGMKRKRKRYYIKKFTREMYRGLSTASSEHDKLSAVCHWHQRMLRMEPAGDGNTRTTCLFLNKHLCEIGLTPVILFWPDGGNLYSSHEMVAVVKESMRAWEFARQYPDTEKTYPYSMF